MPEIKQICSYLVVSPSESSLSVVSLVIALVIRPVDSDASERADEEDANVCEVHEKEGEGEPLAVIWASARTRAIVILEFGKACVKSVSRRFAVQAELVNLVDILAEVLLILGEESDSFPILEDQVDVVANTLLVLVLHFNWVDVEQVAHPMHLDLLPIQGEVAEHGD